MFDSSHPLYVPILLPGDRDAFSDTGNWDAVLLSASYAVGSQGRSLCALARARSRLLLVDPKTACYQFEGYMSMEDLRSLSYSPGAGTLGALWQPREFERQERRARLIAEVFGTQRALQADMLLAPYFLVSQVDHPWLQIASCTIREAVARETDRPVAGVVCVEIDTILQPGDLDSVLDAFTATTPAAWLVVVVNHDEREASPQEMEAVVGLIRGLGGSGAPVIHAFAGRGGLVAAAAGAAGYAAGALELEAHPRRYLREGLVNLHANGYYLQGCMTRLPVRLADAVVSVQPDAWGSDESTVPITRLVSRRRIARALRSKRAEMEMLAAVAPESRQEHLRARFEAALDTCRHAQRRVADAAGPEQLTTGIFHYLEVLREMVGGDAASIPNSAGF